uniref:SIGLEC family like 1 n=1 Tax=Molossus molossus TaxID=27622 RepID=A0A7J8CB11_MOLMO|nr:SIGLEC family like 1 [Molossus molossus]
MGQPPKGLEPARLVSSSCSWKKILQCTCSFHGVPTPSVQWWIESHIVGVDSTNDSHRVNSTILAPWNNTTISLTELPKMGTRLLCEGENEYGNYSMSIVLMSIKSYLITQNFISGLFQGLICGAIVTTLLFLCLIPLIVKYVRKKLSNKIEVTETEGSLSDPSVALKPEEPGRAVVMPSSVSWNVDLLP